VAQVDAATNFLKKGTWDLRSNVKGVIGKKRLGKFQGDSISGFHSVEVKAAQPIGIGKTYELFLTDSKTALGRRAPSKASETLV